MKATATQLTKVKSQDQMKAILENAKGNIYAEPHPQGYEIHDLRPLMEQLEKPIKGKGVLLYFGSSHKVVTAKLLSKFQVIHATP